MYKKRGRLVIDRVNSNTSRKGQVTVFIILGILMLLALALVLTLKTDIITIDTEIIPSQKGKVEQFVTTCIDQIGEEALLKIGLQAGYIEIPPAISSDAGKHLKTSPFTLIPYWAYGPQTNIPSLQLIKERIDRYIDENLRICLFSMQAFQETYDLTEKSEITSDTQIGDQKVIFRVHWNIEVRDKAGEVVAELINHETDSPIKLKRVYEMASRIVEKEMATLKLEDITQDLIALEHPHLPAAGMDLSCSKKTWSVAKAKQTLLDLLRNNIGKLRIKNSDFVTFPDAFYPEFENGLTYYQSHYVWDIGEGVPEDVGVVFNFDESYPHTFGVTPLSGGKMKSGQLGGSDMLSALCIQNWKFTYDMVYPVVVQVRDETTGYYLNTAFTVHVLQNLPNRGEAVGRESYSIDTVTDEDYCKNMNIPMTVRTYEAVQNDEFVDYRDDLGGVDISFTCLRYRCEMGPADSNFGNQGFAGLTANFPYCVGGILRGEKEGYKEAWERVVTKPNTEIELNLAPLIKVPLEMVKVVKHTVYGDLVGPPTNLAAGQSALITMKYYTSENPNEPFHELTTVVSPDRESALGEIELLAKADFTYELDVQVVDETKFIGGYKANWTINWDDLFQANEIVIHTVAKDNPSEDDMIELLLGLGDFSKKVPMPEVR